MNSVHDMGGMHGMGPVQPEKNEPVFHARWEARVFALNRAVGAWGKWNIDASRHQKERIPAAEYLRMSYDEKVLVGMTELSSRAGWSARQTSRAESRRAVEEGDARWTADKVPVLVAKGAPRAGMRQPREVPRRRRIRTRTSKSIRPAIPGCPATRAESWVRLNATMAFSCSRTNATSPERTRRTCTRCASTARRAWGAQASRRMPLREPVGRPS